MKHHLTTVIEALELSKERDTTLDESYNEDSTEDITYSRFMLSASDTGTKRQSYSSGIRLVESGLMG